MIEISEAEISKRLTFQNLMFNSTLLIAWFIVAILVDNKISLFIVSVSIGLFAKDTINTYLQYREWCSLISEYNKMRNDIKAMTN